MSDSTITDTLKEDLTDLYTFTCEPEWQEEWKEKWYKLLQLEPHEKYALDKIIAKLHRQLTGTPEPLPLHILLMLEMLGNNPEDKLADGGHEGLRKSIASLGHLENYLINNLIFTGAFLYMRDRALDVMFQELEKSNVWCMRPFLGY